MNKEEAASQLDGSEYSKEGSKELFAAMKAAGLVAVFGASDDLMEFRGAIHDEIWAYDGTTAYLTPKGLLENKCQNDNCPYHKLEIEKATAIEASWDDAGYSWRYLTTIPHAEFDVKDDGESYCRGIVFALADVTSS